MEYLLFIGMVPSLQLDESLETPLYRQLYEKLKLAIEQGVLEPDERLPATRELAGQLGVNRQTVSSAYELLESEHLIRGEVGRGSFVNGAAPAAAVAWEWDGWLGPAPGTPAGTLSDVAVSFAVVRPAGGQLPLEEFRACAREVIAEPEAARLLQLGAAAGYAPLRGYLLEQARAEGAAKAADDLIITNGCQNALDLLQRVMVPAGATVALEEPVYAGLREVFARGGARLVGVPVTERGLDLEVLARVLLRERPRLLVVTSNFQNPTGTTLTLEARHTVLRLAREAGGAIVENDIYGELRYRGEVLPTLKQLDADGRVILLRSFSKLAFPGLRVGWVIAPVAVTRRLAQAKQWSDLHTDQLSQAILLRLAVSGRLAGHRRRAVAAQGERLDVLLETLGREMPAGVRWTRPEGGWHLWLELPEPLDAGELLPRAEREGVNYLPGKMFAVSRDQSRGLRLSFASLTPDEIRRGVEALGAMFRQEWDRAQARKRPEQAPALV
jgi:2-aminoadipate transaminase